MRAANCRHNDGDKGEASLRPSCSPNCWARIFSIASPSCRASSASNLPRLMSASSWLRCWSSTSRCRVMLRSSVAPSSSGPSWAMRASTCASNGTNAACAVSASRLACMARSDSVTSVSGASASSSERRTACTARSARVMLACGEGLASSVLSAAHAVSAGMPPTASNRVNSSVRNREKTRQDKAHIQEIRADHRACVHYKPAHVSAGCTAPAPQENQVLHRIQMQSMASSAMCSSRPMPNKRVRCGTSKPA